MTGQDAVTVAEAFNERLGITGVILTKMDGDARGGAALSIKSVTGAPVKFVGMGEKLSEMEVFHPDRVAGRILGMGDVLTLLEKAQDNINAEEAEELARKMQKARFDLEDFRTQMRRMRKIGSFESILKHIPGLGGLANQLAELGDHEKELNRTEAIINSMTMKERRNPDIINGSRRARIARGSGTTVQQVNQLLKQFDQMRRMMQSVMRPADACRSFPAAWAASGEWRGPARHGRSGRASGHGSRHSRSGRRFSLPARQRQIRRQEKARQEQAQEQKKVASRCFHLTGVSYVR